MSHTNRVAAALPEEPRARRAALRTATAEDVQDILALIVDNLDSGHLLPRSHDDVSRHVHRFVVATLPRAEAGRGVGLQADDTSGPVATLPRMEDVRGVGLQANGTGGRSESSETDGEVVIGCAELAPLSRAVAEVRSLVVRADARGRGVGSQLLRELGTRARREGFSVLCAFTHEPHPFVRLGFSIAPHVWFPEKVALDCTGCAKFRVCGQHAMALALTEERSLPSPQRLREPLTASSSRTRGATLPPIRLRVIA